jgi:hypothetical protein
MKILHVRSPSWILMWQLPFSSFVLVLCAGVSVLHQMAEEKDHESARIYGKRVGLQGNRALSCLTVGRRGCAF